MGTCSSDLVDLDTAGQHTGNQIVYMGSVRGGDGQLDPLPGCTTGTTLNEKAHHLTVTERSRITAHTYGTGTPNLDSVVYIRTACEDASSEIACNDDAAGGVQSVTVADDVAAGTQLFIVVDAAQNQPVALPQPYSLTVIMTPVVTAGTACDPTGATSVCEPGTVCSVAGGSPICAASLGGPTLGTVSARERENHSSMEIDFAGSDPDGDVLQVLTRFIDSSGNVIDFSGDGVPDEYNFAPADPLPGSLTFSTHIGLLGLSAATLDLIAGVRVRLIDSAGMESASVDAPMAHPVLVDTGDTCGTPDVECRGELSCTGTCAEPTDSVNVCAAVDATTPISAPGTYTVTIPTGAPDNFMGSCYWDEGLGEQVLKLTIAGPHAQRVTAHTDVAPSSAMLDSYVYLRSTCTDPATEVGCNDDAASSAGSPLASSMSVSLNPGTYYLFIDGSSVGGGWVADGDIGVAIEMTDLLDPGAACTPGQECAPGYICADAAGGTSYTCTDMATLVAAECASAPVIVPGTAVTGTVSMSSTSLVEGSCRYAGPYPEQYHNLVLTGKADVTATTAGSGTNFDTVVFFLDSCSASASEVPGSCNDDIDASLPNWRSSVTVTLDPGDYAVIVDMSSPNLPDGTGASPDPASYSLLVTVKPVLASGELCDPTGTANRCDDGLTCTGTPATCM